MLDKKHKALADKIGLLLAWNDLSEEDLSTLIEMYSNTDYPTQSFHAAYKAAEQKNVDALNNTLSKALKQRAWPATEWRLKDYGHYRRLYRIANWMYTYLPPGTPVPLRLFLDKKDCKVVREFVKLEESAENARVCTVYSKSNAYKSKKNFEVRTFRT